MMQYTAVDSSMIDLIGYDEDTQLLEVRFVNTGYTYECEDVPKEEYEENSKNRYNSIALIPSLAKRLLP